jgi:hypothetical protein
MEGDDLARLEAALDRIAQNAQHNAQQSTVSPEPAVPVEAIAARLDTLIADIRGALANED